MASTSEELSGQAEQLQHAIAFFRVDGVRTRRAAPAIPRPQRKPVVVHRPAAKPAIGHHALPHSPARPAANGKKPGVTLAMGENGAATDAMDHDFEAY